MQNSSEIRWEPTIPNKITLARIVAAVPIVLAHRYGFPILACVLFLLACVSDILDGQLARRLKRETRWGHIGDPVADKLCCAAASIVCLAEFGHSMAFTLPVILIFGYDALVIWMRRRVRHMPTLQIAKWKTAALMIALFSGLATLSCQSLLHGNWFYPNIFFGQVWLTGIMYVMLWIASVLAVLSALQYARQQRTRQSVAALPAE